ncbi:MAG: pyridoxamine 5'-phosphate oxidase family protein [Muribaculaceae bacterium]|nr:pyridoxamine 5'-phosphate oxidase family protein [Muribaculaceae bacterium]
MEFRKMRRFRQQLTFHDCIAILESSTSGTLALLGDNGYPYAVPISYVYSDGKLYFHSAKSGHKIDAIRCCDKASFCIIATDDIHPAEFTTYFKSVIVFGRIQIVESNEERLTAATLLGKKYNPHDTVGLDNEIEKSLSHMLVLRLDIEHISGKEAIELTKSRS